MTERDSTNFDDERASVHRRRAFAIYSILSPIPASVPRAEVAGSRRYFCSLGLPGTIEIWSSDCRHSPAGPANAALTRRGMLATQTKSSLAPYLTASPSSATRGASPSDSTKLLGGGLPAEGRASRAFARTIINRIGIAATGGGDGSHDGPHGRAKHRRLSSHFRHSRPRSRRSERFERTGNAADISSGTEDATIVTIKIFGLAAVVVHREEERQFRALSSCLIATVTRPSFSGSAALLHK